MLLFAGLQACIASPAVSADTYGHAPHGTTGPRTCHCSEDPKKGAMRCPQTTTPRAPSPHGRRSKQGGWGALAAESHCGPGSEGWARASETHRAPARPFAAAEMPKGGHYTDERAPSRCQYMHHPPRHARLGCHSSGPDARAIRFGLHRPEPAGLVHKDVHQPRLLQTVRRGTESMVTWRRAQMVLLSAEVMAVTKIAEATFTCQRVATGLQQHAAWRHLQPARSHLGVVGAHLTRDCDRTPWSSCTAEQRWSPHSVLPSGCTCSKSRPAHEGRPAWRCRPCRLSGP